MEETVTTSVGKIDYEEDRDSYMDTSMVSSTTSPTQSAYKCEFSNIESGYLMCSEQWEPGEILDNPKRYPNVSAQRQERSFRRSLQVK